MDTIQLYYNASERKVIGKNLTQVGNPIQCVVKGDASIMSPIFIFNSNGNYPVGVNYLYWADTGRYYFIDDIQVLTGSRMALHCSVDVLETYGSNIKNQVAIVDKQQHESNLYYNDGSFIKDSREFYTVHSFSNGFNDTGKYVLITAGGHGIIPE